jgi:hypothetical protein
MARTHDSGEYRYVRGKLQLNRERMTVRGFEHQNRRHFHRSIADSGHP